MAMNVFTALFDYRPRADLTPEENFLTASLASMLSNSPAFRTAFVCWATKNELSPEVIASVDIQTQVSLRTPDGAPMRPDMQLAIRTTQGQTVLIRCEHKWRSSFDPNQVGFYRAIDIPRGATVRTVFISSIDGDVRAAAHACDRSAHWRDIGQLAAPFTQSDTLLSQWTEFLSGQGLTAGSAQADDDLTYRLTDVCQRLNARKDWWSWMPTPFRASQRLEGPSWDRVGVYFGLKDQPFGRSNVWCWIAGFRFAPKNMKMPLLDTKLGCDLFLTLHAPPDHVFDEQVLADAANRVEAVERKAKRPVRVLSGAMVPVRWYKLLIVAPVADLGVSLDDPEGLAKAAAHRFAEWGAAVFQDKALEREVLSRWPSQLA